MKELDRNNTGVTQIFAPGERITNALLLNASFINNIGLMHGKMGISIYFYRLTRETKNQIYEDYAGELIDEIYEEITNSTPWDFENGLAGIGWGIEYLVQNGFIEADTDEVLEEFDNRIFRQLIYSPPAEPDLLNGLLGIGFYFLKRIQNPNSNDDNIKTLTNKQTLIHLIDELDLRLTEEQIWKLLDCENKKDSYLSNSPEGERLISATRQKSPLGEIGVRETFNITHNYPLLLWFLAEMYEQDIFNFKVEKIITRLLKPLEDDSNLPKLQFNRLLLELSLLKLKTVGWTYPAGILDLNLETRNIEHEIGTNPTVKNGTAGAAWIYGQLFELTGNPEYKQEAEYWAKQTHSCCREDMDNGFAGFDLKDDTKAFGLLEGIAGIGFINSLTKQQRNTKKE